MAPIPVVLVLLAIVKTEITVASAEARLSQLLTFPAQIRTSGALAAPTGYNLNDGREALPIGRKDFQAISKASPHDDKKAERESNTLAPNQKDGEIINLIKPLPMVWENCMETTFKGNQAVDTIKATDMETVQNYPIPNLKSRRSNLTTTWNKRDAQNYNISAARNAWIEKYNSLLNSKADGRRQQKPDYVPVRKTSLSLDTTEFITTISTSSTTIPQTTAFASFTSTPTSTTVSTTFDPDLSITTDLSDFDDIPVIAITRKVLREEIEIQNVTETNIVKSYTEDWLDLKKVKEKSKIRFNSMLQRTTYLIPTLRLDDGFHSFGFMSEFFYLIYPFEFPVGLIKDIVWGEFTFPYSFLQSIKVESTFLAFIILFACIALVIPSYLFILAVLALFSKSRCDDELETGALFPDAEESDCNDKLLVTLTLMVLLISCALLTGMAISNEQAHYAGTSARNVVNCAFSDLATWLSAAARELHHSLVPPVDLVLHAFKEDLNNVEALLGEPIQQAIASESGIDLVFDSLADIIEESEELASKIASLRDISIKSGGMASAASDRIRELARQVDNLKKHCTMKDMPLCDTLNTNSLELKMKFDLTVANNREVSTDPSIPVGSVPKTLLPDPHQLTSHALDEYKGGFQSGTSASKTIGKKPISNDFDEIILHEQQLLQLRSLGVENLTRAISEARKEFRSLPSAITSQTEKVREAIIRDIVTRRQSVHDSVQVLNDIVRHLTASLHTASRQLESGFERVQKYEFGRWTLMLACIVILGFVIALILMALLCGCGHAKNHAQRTLKVSAVWICLASLILWGLISTIFLITGHAEIYVCHALWDSPQYSTLVALLDRPSPLLSNNEGVFDAMFREMENITIDVSIRDVLRDCEQDKPAYVVFQLDKVLDVNKETSYFEWTELQADLGKLRSAVDVGLLKTISASFSLLLSQMLVVSDVNLAKYRMEYNGPVVGKDLPSLVDQLENIAAQVTDLTTAGRLETIASRTQRLYSSNIKPLEQLRAEVVFKLTELELQLLPFRRKLNISLSHIHTAQYYIDNQGDVIAQKKISLFVSRLVSHAAGWRTHVLTSTSRHAAKCMPLFTVFAGARSLLCTNYIDSLHTWWVSACCLGVLWTTMLTPLCVKLWRTYAWKIKAHEAISLTNLATGQQETPTTAPCDNSNWNTPGPPAPPPRNDSW